MEAMGQMRHPEPSVATRGKAQAHTVTFGTGSLTHCVRVMLSVSATWLEASVCICRGFVRLTTASLGKNLRWNVYLYPDKTLISIGQFLSSAVSPTCTNATSPHGEITGIYTEGFDEEWPVSSL